MRNPACDICELYVAVKTVCVWGDGKPGGIMFIGEAPGAEEDRKGKPFIGRAGKRLKDELLNANILPSIPVYISNVVKCRPPSNRKPTAAELNRCSKNYLFPEIQDVKPKLIVTLGNSPLQVLVKGIKDDDERAKGVLKKRGKFYATQHGTVFATVHPQFINYNPTYLRKFRQDLQVCKHFHDHGIPVIDYILAETVDEIKDFVSEGGSVLAVDLETTGLDPTEKGAAIVTWNFHNGCKPIIYRPKGNKDNVEIAKWLEKSDYKLIGHNTKFDWKWIVHLTGVMLKTYWDTELAEAVLDEWDAPYALKKLTSKYDVAHAGYELILGDHSLEGGAAAIPEDVLNPYAAGDGLVTTNVFHAQLPQITERNLNDLVALQCDTSDVLVGMELRGIKVNREQLRKERVRAEKIISDALAVLPDDLNVKSPIQVRDYLFQTLGLKPLTTSKQTGSSSTDKFTLAYYFDVPEVQAIYNIRKYEKRLSTYIDKFLELTENENRLHTKFWLDVAVTGRLASSKPNLQNVPRDSSMKTAFIPDDGYLLISADYSQIEMRFLAHFSGDSRLVTAYKSGADVHSLTASIVLDKPPEDVTGEERYVAKRVNFGIMYGMGPYRLAKEMVKARADEGIDIKLTEDEATRFISGYFATYPGVKEHIEARRRQVQEDGYVQGILGRARRLYNLKYERDSRRREEIYRQAVNAPVQGSASMVTQMALVKIANDKELQRMGYIPLLTVHDEILGQVPKEFATEAARRVKTIMEGAYKISVPLDVDVKVGETWGTCKEIS